MAARKRIVLVLISAFVLAGCVAAYFGGQRVTKDVVYFSRDGSDLKMDLYRPILPGEYPVIIAIHGGFWTMGDRQQLAPYCIWLVHRGFAVACIDYSLAPQNTFSDSVDDVSQAIRFVKKSGNLYSLDPSRIALLGVSSGAHLAAMSVLQQDPETQVQAVVDLYGPTDLTTQHMAEDTTVQEVFGRDLSALRGASPLHNLNGHYPPFLIVHGEQDLVVPLEQSEAFLARLQETGNQASLLLVRNAGHDFVPIGGQPQPSLIQVAGKIADFLDHTLGPGGGISPTYSAKAK